MRVATLVAIVGLAAVAVAPTAAHAFRPPVKWLLDRAMDKAVERGTKSAKVDAVVTVYDAGGRPRGLDVAERVWLSASPTGVALLRRETDQEGGQTVEIRAEGKNLTRAPGQPEKSQKAGVDALADMVAFAPPADGAIAADRLIAAFKGLGVNTEVVSYARFDARVAYLIGSKPWETDKPQVWIEKDSLLPMRVVTFQKGSDGAMTKVDLRYLGWGSPVGGLWYPQAIEVWRNDKLVRRSVTQNVERNLPVDATLFK